MKAFFVFIFIVFFMAACTEISLGSGSIARIYEQRFNL